MGARHALGAFCAVLAGASAVLAAEGDLLVRDCSPVTVTATQFCTVTVIERVTAKVYATGTVTGPTVTETPTTTVYTYSNSSVPAATSSLPASSSSVLVSSSSVPVSSSSAPVSSSSVPVSSTSSTSSTAALPTTCDNSGIDFAYYVNDNKNSDTVYSSFLPEAFKSVTPVYENVTAEMGIAFSSSSGPIYGSEDDYSYTYFALNHHTYLFAIETGNYTVSVSNIDDALFVWTGAKAYSGWTRDNADMFAYYGSKSGTEDKSYSFTAAAGEYVPLRFMFAQAQGDGGFDFSLTSPSGKELVGSATTASPYIFRYSCDGIAAPKYAAFGSET